jgi:hypothetical protein
MKTALVTDELSTLLDVAAARANKPDKDTFLEQDR